MQLESPQEIARALMYDYGHDRGIAYAERITASATLPSVALAYAQAKTMIEHDRDRMNARQQREMTAEEIANEPSLPANMMDIIRKDPRFTAQRRERGGWDIYFCGKWAAGTKSSHEQYGLAALRVAHRTYATSAA